MKTKILLVVCVISFSIATLAVRVHAKIATSTLKARAEARFEKKDIRNSKLKIKSMKVDAYEIRKNTLVSELQTALTNITNDKLKVENYLKNNLKNATSTSTGTSTIAEMDKIKTSLTSINEKLITSKSNIDTLSKMDYSTSTASTTNINLDKPRKAGDTAIKTLKDARDSLKNVIQLIISIQPESLEVINFKNNLKTWI